jgi:altronate dehydratase
MATRKRGHIDLAFEGDQGADGQKSTSGPVAAHAPEPAQKEEVTTYKMRDVALLPTPADNCAICTRRLEVGWKIVDGDRVIVLANTMMEGHRFCHTPIAKGQPLLSWGLPFGFAKRDIKAGEYVVNQGVLESLALRGLDFALPAEPNFEYKITPAILDRDFTAPGKPIELYKNPGTFQGYPRPASRRAGTRNHILVLGVTSSVGPLARSLENRMKSEKTVDFAAYPNIDGVVSVAHTEGGTDAPMNNISLVLRTLAGFIVHGNVGAVLIVDRPTLNDDPNVLSMRTLLDYVRKNNFPIDDVLHATYETTGNMHVDIDNCIAKIRGFLKDVNAVQRVPIPLAQLSVALQCGGSDAFSGISGNPLAAVGAKELIKHGGAAVLAETDELIGAEKYILRMCRSKEVAKKFLETIARFTEWTEWHGHNPEGNPSGGNKFRGLYNIALKSLGAACKKDPEITLDGVVAYSERVTEGGYYFMDSPGNDLESIAGQVATGCQLIYFITGNGSITNFPFVPTIKIVTTTNRFNLLKNDMDINAGAYQDGTPMVELGKVLFDYTVEVSSGLRSVGEKAQHAQVSIWRDWPMAVRDDKLLAELNSRPGTLAGTSIATHSVKSGDQSSGVTFLGLPSPNSGADSFATDQVALLLPTSLCSSEIARVMADKLNEDLLKDPHAYTVSRFVTLPHTEGCGMSAGSCEDIYRRTMLSHMLSPVVNYGVFLEHGCERTHNDYMGHHLESDMGIQRNKFGWASIQLDGGIEKVSNKVKGLFGANVHKGPSAVTQRKAVSLKHLRVALASPPHMKLSDEAARALAAIARLVIDAGGTVVLPLASDLTKNHMFLGEVLEPSAFVESVKPTIAYAQRPKNQGLHIMETLSDNWTELMTGLGGTGVEIAIVVTEGKYVSLPLISHPMVNLIKVANPHASTIAIPEGALQDYDYVLSPNFGEWYKELQKVLLEVASGQRRVKNTENSDFQISRGPTGISV